MTTMRVVGECFFWYRLTRVFPDKFHRAVKRLCVCVYEATATLPHQLAVTQVTIPVRSCPTAGKVTVGQALYWPRFTDLSETVYPPTGSRPKEGLCVGQADAF